MNERACVYLRDSPDGNVWLCFCGLALSLLCVCVRVYACVRALSNMFVRTAVFLSSINMILNVSFVVFWMLVSFNCRYTQSGEANIASGRKKIGVAASMGVEIKKTNHIITDNDGVLFFCLSSLSIESKTI